MSSMNLEESPSPRAKRKSVAILWAIFLVALIIRIAGMQWGLPSEKNTFSLHPDEPIVLGYSAQIDVAKGKLDPNFYNYGSLYLTTLSIANKVSTFYAPAGEGPQAEIQTLRTMHLTGRWISVFAGAGLVAVTFWMLLLWLPLWASVMGAAMVAVSPPLVMHSRFQTVDMLATFLLAVGLFYAVKIMVTSAANPPDIVRWTIASGLFIGLSAGTKYSGAIAFVALFFALWFVAKEIRLKALGAGFLCMILGFLLGTPGALLNTQAFLRDFSYELGHTAAGHGFVFVETPSGFLYHFGNLVQCAGLAGLLLGLAGLGVALYKRQPESRPLIGLALFAAVFYIAIGRAEVKFIRYVFPLVPVVAAGFASLIANAHKSNSAWGRGGVVVGILTLGGAGGQGGLQNALLFTQWMSAPDTRAVAVDYIKNKLKPTSVGLVSDAWFYTPLFYPEVGAPRAVPIEKRLEFMAAAQNPRIVQYTTADPSQRRNWDTRLLTETKPDVVVLSSFELDDMDRIYKAGLDRGNPEAEWNRAHLFMEQLRTLYTPEIVFGEDRPTIHDLMYVRPAIYIWKRKGI